MANIIDALVVTLGLDASGFKTGTRQVDESLDRTRKGTDRTAKEIEASGKRAAQFVNRLKAEFIGLFATITAGKGLANFVSDSVSGTAALGRMAANLNMSAKELDGWSKAAEAFGGTAQGVQGSLQGIAAGIQQFALTGQSDLIPIFRTLGVEVADGAGKVRDYREIMLDVADRLKGMNPQEALAFGKMLGLDDGTINLLRQGRAGVQDLVAEFTRASGVSQKSVEASQRIQKQMALFRQQMEGVGQSLYEAMGPGLERITGDLGELSQWLSDHREEISQVFLEGVKAVETLVNAFHELDQATDGNASKVALAVAGLWALVTVLGAVAAGMRTVVGLGAATGGALLRAVPPALAGAAGYALGSEINERFIEPNAELSDAIGGTLATLVAKYGWGDMQKEAQHALDVNLAVKAGLPPPPPLEVRQGRDGEPGKSGSTGAPGADGADGAPGRPASAEPQAPRGIRNNNPGNLNFVGQAGATKEDGPNGRFAVFSSMEEGIAALVKQLQRYMGRGIDTIRELVNTYAPGSDGNDTGAYMGALAKALGIGADDKLDLSNPQQLAALVKGITNHENGAGRLSDSQILAGIQLGAGAAPSTARAVGGGGDTRIQSETHIGKIEVKTSATDAKGIARDIGSALGDKGIAYQASMGDS